MKLKYEIILDRGDRTIILQCITKWEIVWSLHNGGYEESAETIGKDSCNCALCERYMKRLGFSYTCEGCPLYEATGLRCAEQNAPWHRWLNDPREDTARVMVETLKLLLVK